MQAFDTTRLCSVLPSYKNGANASLAKIISFVLCKPTGVFLERQGSSKAFWHYALEAIVITAFSSGLVKLDIEKPYKKPLLLFVHSIYKLIISETMKLSILSALLAISAASVSAAPSYSFSGTIYVYVNSIPHPKTTFLKKGSGNNLLTDGVACKGSKTLPGTGDALKGTFTTVKNQWDFNGEHDNEIRMGK